VVALLNEYFFDYTAHGDAISASSRLEGASKRFGTRICAAQAFAALVGEVGDDPLASFHLRRLLTGESGIEIDLAAG